MHFMVVTIPGFSQSSTSNIMVHVPVDDRFVANTFLNFIPAKFNQRFKSSTKSAFLTLTNLMF